MAYLHLRDDLSHTLHRHTDACRRLRVSKHYPSLLRNLSPWHLSCPAFFALETSISSATSFSSCTTPETPRWDTELDNCLRRSSLCMEIAFRLGGMFELIDPTLALCRPALFVVCLFAVPCPVGCFTTVMPGEWTKKSHV